MRAEPTLVVGAGIGGLAAALTLAAAGQPVTLLEAAAVPGGRMRTAAPGGQAVDAGPTVMTLVRVFAALYEALGERLEDHVTLEPLDILARHAWADGSRLDLHADPHASRAAIEAFAGAAAGRGFDQFLRTARRLQHGLGEHFMEAQRPSLLGFAARLGPWQAWRLRAGSPFRTLWQALGDYFPDPRLRQLFGRYATYVGSSPFEAPAVLMLIAQVEMAGVSGVRGGMTRLAHALAELAQRHGVEIHYNRSVREIEVRNGVARGVICSDGTRFPAEAVIFNGDPNALELGLLGPGVRGATPASRPRQASLSALTHAWLARPSGFELAHHTVFFSDDYPREFEQIFRQNRMPDAPSVYLCAQDRGLLTGHHPASSATDGNERLFAIINAPAPGVDEAGRPRPGPTPAACQETRDAALQLLTRCGLQLAIEAEVQTTPGDFADRFPGSGGAIYGAACHGWSAPFRRPSARTAVSGLYLAGGGVHPGPGVPMVALSGLLAAEALIFDYGHAALTPGKRRKPRSTVPADKATTIVRPTVPEPVGEPLPESFAAGGRDGAVGLARSGMPPAQVVATERPADDRLPQPQADLRPSRTDAS